MNLKEVLCRICDKSFLKKKDSQKMDFLDYICPNCIELMKICPVCKKENHNSDIYNFLTSRDEKIKKRRESFFSLLKIKDKLINIKIGIPCCSCFNLVFDNKSHRPFHNFTQSYRNYQDLSLRVIEQNIEINNQNVYLSNQNFKEFYRNRVIQSFREFYRNIIFNKRELSPPLKSLIARLIVKISIEDNIDIEDAFLIYVNHLTPNMQRYDINSSKDELIRNAKERIKKMNCKIKRYLKNNKKKSLILNLK